MWVDGRGKRVENVCRVMFQFTPQAGRWNLSGRNVIYRLTFPFFPLFGLHLPASVFRLPGFTEHAVGMIWKGKNDVFCD